MNKNYPISKINLLLRKFLAKFRLLLMVLFVFLTPMVSFGQTTKSFTSSGIFTIPCGVTSVTVKVWGAGGGGNNDTNYGGGGGAFAQSTFAVSSADVYAITVGLGASSGSGAAGGDSSFGSIVVAKGGKGGSFKNGGLVSQSIGDIKFKGGDGGKSTGNAGAGGGAGAGTANNGANGEDASGYTRGSGGVGLNGGGNGGNGGANYNSGSNGAFPGGGGGERGKSGSSSGGGGNGLIEIIYTSPFNSYCIPSYNNRVEPITNVTFAGINNTTTNITGGASLEVFCSPLATVIQGSGTNAISVKGNTVGNYSNTIKVFIDWDQNGFFGNNPNEKYDLGTIVNSTGIDAKFATGNIPVPLTALLGSTMMRVVKTFNSSGTNSNDPCFSGNDFGQAEDYIVTVIAPVPTIGSLSATSGCVGSSVTITGTNLAGATAATVKIGGTAVASITSISATQIVAIIGSGTTGNVTVTTPSGTATTNAVFMVNASSFGGTVAGGTTVCSGSNSTVLTLSGHTGTVIRWESSLDNFATPGNVIANTSTTLTATNLSATTSYRAVLQSGACAEVPSASATITLETNTWKVILGVAQWQKGTPKDDQRIVFEANYNQNVNLQACSCEVKSGNVTIQDGKTLTLTNELKVTGGSLTFENNASLVQTSTTATNNNIGKIYYKRHTTAVRRYDFTYWSSPVQPQTMIALSPNTLSDKFWSFDSDANDWVLSDGGGATMEPANGYSIRAPQTSDIVTAAIDTNPTFFGVPNNGNYTVSSTATAVNNKSYLLGNPYPSALDAITFLNNNSVLDGTLYFWTHNSNVTAVGAFYEYSDNDYATFNLTGGTGVASTNPGVSTSPPTGKIAAGQGFFATGIATGPINFTNAMRVGVGSITGDNSQFFRTTKTKAKTTTAIEKNRVWLNLYNTKGAFKQALIGYVTGATNAYDSGYDGESFDGNEFVDFYSVTPENYLVIQGRALPFDETDTVPLGYRSKEEMNLNISIDQTDGVLATQNIYIEDKLLNVIHNIKDTPYAFTTEAGTFDNRFVLRYTDKTLGNTDFEGVNSSVVISKDKNELKIKSEIETIKRITVYDLLGKKVFEKEAVNSTEFRSSAIGFSQQIGIVKVTLDNGQVISKKVIF